jgi:hypothetical protein
MIATMLPALPGTRRQQHDNHTAPHIPTVRPPARLAHDLFVGWGELPYISEFSPAGQPLFNARLPAGVSTYRAAFDAGPPSGHPVVVLGIRRRGHRFPAGRGRRGLPLWLRMFGDVRRARRRREVAWLLAPAVVPAAYLAVSAAIAGLVRRAGASVVPWQARSVVDLANGNLGPWWFLALLLLGFVAAAVSAAGPGLALRRLRPEGPAVIRATRAAGLAAATMVLAGVTSVVAAVGLYLWAPAYAGYHESWPLAIYLPAVLLAAATAIVSAARGVRACHSPAA